MKKKYIKVVEYAIGEKFYLEGNLYSCVEKYIGCHECAFYIDRYHSCPHNFNEIENNCLNCGLLCKSEEREDKLDVCFQLTDR